MEPGPIYHEEFPADGRGPILERIHWANSGRVLRAIDFSNPGDSLPHHVFFEGVQVAMITPEEVIDYGGLSSLWFTHPRAGLMCLGKSVWLKSFSGNQLHNCFHFQLMFYDELLDVICERLEIREGWYQGGVIQSEDRL